MSPTTPTPTDDRAVDLPRVLARCRETVRPALHESLAQLPASLRQTAAFALGWCDERGTPTPEGGGKGVRQALAILSAQAVGGTADGAVAGAAAVELVHLFSLVHDDIIDGDERRRHRPTVWKAYGTGSAVLTGDALLALAAQLLSGDDRGPEAVRRLAATLVELVRGQAEDLDFQRRPWTGPRAVALTEYRSMAERKTGSLIGCACALGAHLAGAPSTTVTSFEAAGRHLGIAFQAVDDELGLWGDPASTGKPVLSDLVEDRKTLPVLAALASRHPAADRLRRLLADTEHRRGATSHEEAALVQQAGGRRTTHRTAQRHLHRALTALQDLPLHDPAAAQLAALARFTVERAS